MSMARACTQQHCGCDGAERRHHKHIPGGAVAVTATIIAAGVAGRAAAAAAATAVRAANAPGHPIIDRRRALAGAAQTATCAVGQ